MNKAELIEAIADKVGVSKKESEAMLDAFVDIVTSSLQQHKEVTITGFGTFLARYRSARKGVNPQNPSEIIDIPGVTVAKFKTGSALKKALKDVVPGDASESQENDMTQGQ